MPVEDHVDTQVGKQIRAGRQRIGMSRSRFADAANVSLEKLMSHESGSERASVQCLFAYAGILNVHIKYFHEGFSPGCNSKKISDCSR